MAGARDFSVLQNIQIGSGAHPFSCQWVPVVLSRSQCEVHHSPLSNNEVKKLQVTFTLQVNLAHHGYV
jgi:hypothetical protein